MRHLGSIILSLLLSAAIYVLVGVGVIYWARSGDQLSGIDYKELGLGAGALAAAGALYAILLLVRLSPVGPLLAGLAFAGVAAWAKLATENFTDLMPRSIAGLNGAGWAPAGPVAVALAVGLLGTCFTRRWRNATADADAEESVEDTLVYSA